MTRKEALQRAILALSADPAQAEAVEKLRDLLAELPIIHWTDKAISDRVEQFVAENGRPPIPSEFRNAGMPPHAIFRERYGITVKQWLAIHYPSANPSPEELARQYTEQFIEEFHRLQPTSAKAYNKNKAPGVKCWRTVARLYGDITWTQLLSHLDLKLESKPNPAEMISVTVHNDYDFRD